MKIQKISNAINNIIQDPIQFIKRLKIKDNRGKLVNFKLNDEQVVLLDRLINSDKHLVVLKSRQIGSSTLVSAYLFWKWYSSSEPITIAILSHKLASSRHLLNMWFRFYDNLPNSLKRPLSKRNTTEMVLHGSGAEVMAISAKGEGGLRSFSANYIHLSEYAFAPNAEELKATAISSLNNGRLIQESTANNFGDPHHIDVLKAQRGEANLELLFFPWSMHKAYRKHHITSNPNWTEEEQELIIKEILTPYQVMWRREKIEQLGFHKFRREYPLTIDDAYAGGSNSYFIPACFTYLSSISIDTTDDYITYLEDFNKESAYAVGVDVGSGVGGDPSTIIVLDKITWCPVCIWSSNTTSIIQTADRLEAICAEYNNPKVLIEANSIGSALLLEMRHRNYRNLWQHPQTKQDWMTTTKSKWVMFEELKEALMQGAIKYLDIPTISELRGFVVNEKGNIEYPKNLPTHGDRVVALALALQALKVVSLSNVIDLPAWVRKKRLERRTAGLTFVDRRRY